MKIIIGLGNPGEKYQSSRHNLGFAVVDHLARKLGENGTADEENWEFKEELKSEILQTHFPLSHSTLTLLLAKPQTYMNNSGLAVKSLVNYFKVAIEDVIIVHDDLDLPLGKIKIRFGGAAAGHHGVESVIESLKSDKFIRVRLGIGNTDAFLGEHKRQHFNAEHFVVEPFLPHESSKVKKMVKQSIKALKDLLIDGLEKTQNRFN